ncbi:MAG: hypothetical protein E7598_02045 [Ruminococcaceae bacterium]|nr:hypothetical protein [Oscillospiraceae bacterium]
MNSFTFSLLYPSDEARRAHIAAQNRPAISAETVESLGLSELIKLKNSSLCEYFTSDENVISYRTEIFSDMLAVSEVGETFVKVLPVLSDISELRRLASASERTTDEYLLSLSEIELYISAVEILRDGLAPVRTSLKSEALISLCDYIKEISESDYYTELNEKLSALTSRVRDIKSITIGINLDATLQADKCGVLSINAKPFKSGDTLDKILRMNFSSDEYTLIAPLTPFSKSQNDNQKTAMSLAINSAINSVFKGSVRQWRKIVQEYVLDNTNFLIEVMPEIEFAICAVSLMNRLRERGLPLCKPTLCPIADKVFDAKGIYNPAVALAIEGASVENDFTFDKNGTIYVLTGPNRGGKSVITCATGLSAAFCQLGLLAPAREFKFSPAGGIFTHFPTESGDTVDKGRLGEECARLNEIFEICDDSAIVLLDESLSSTGAYEASYIAAEILLGFSKIGCRTIFSTHLHTLAARVDELNEEACAFSGAKIDTLVAKIADDGTRSFKILRTKPDGKSYAKDIADKYGLSFEKISKTIEKRI